MKRRKEREQDPPNNNHENASTVNGAHSASQNKAFSRQQNFFESPKSASKGHKSDTSADEMNGEEDEDDDDGDWDKFIQDR